MQPSVLFRALLSVGSVSLTAAVLLGTAPASALTINLPSDVTCNWNDSTKVLNCSSVSQPPTNPGGPTNCSLSATPSSLTAAGPVSLSVSCQGTVTGYQWSASPAVQFNSGANTTTNTNSATINANTTRGKRTYQKIFVIHSGTGVVTFMPTACSIILNTSRA